MAKLGTLLTYDIYKDHKTVKEALIKAGWKDTIISDTNVVSHLPNTTFWHGDKSAQTARDEFIEIATFNNIERLMCYEFNIWAGLIGKAHEND